MKQTTDDSSSLRNLSLTEFVNRLASAQPTPGGGAAAALSGTLAAALGRMVCELTLGRPKFAAVEPQVRMIREGLTHAGDMLEVLMDEDALAYGALSAALKLDRADPKRAERIAETAIIAAAVPLQTALLARQVERLAAELDRIGNPMLKADVASSIHLARAAVGAAVANVRANLPLLRETDRARVEHELAGLAGAC